jgi:polysaccharide pyruvyl transferase WcaK-like protein
MRTIPGMGGPPSQPKATILHAYSRRNAGDGLLLDLTLDLLRRAEVDVHAIVAYNAPSFGDIENVVQLPGVSGPAAVRRVRKGLLLAEGLAAASRGRLPADGAVATAVHEADLIVGMGGGYLRARGPRETLATMGSHTSQLAFGVASAKPTLYLPQSVGPFNAMVSSLMRALIRRITLLCVRDDLSAVQVRGLTEACRIPDLAVLWLADSLAGMAAGGDPVAVLVGRRLPHSRDLPVRLKLLAERLRAAGLQVVWAVQSHEPGNDDVGFYSRNGITPEGGLAEALGRHQPGVVISVRLHGALQGLAQGWPAIHLGYERKSWGAYEDLGLSPWVHSAARFDPVAVADQACELIRNPAPFWSGLESRRAQLATRSRELEALVRGLAHGSR